jgi:Domain of unknown function (DUF397)
MNSNDEFGPWRKAEASNSGGGEGGCIELAQIRGGGVAVRDSKDDGKGPVHRFTPGEWAAFCDGMNKGEFADLH